MYPSMFPPRQDYAESNAFYSRSAVFLLFNESSSNDNR